jgi:hypothetical protein
MGVGVLRVKSNSEYGTLDGVHLAVVSCYYKYRIPTGF